MQRCSIINFTKERAALKCDQTSIALHDLVGSLARYTFPLVPQRILIIWPCLIMRHQ